MSKQVRWQIPFVSRLGTDYRVDIYDEQDGSWSGVTQLLGGTSPFTTDEDDSDDYFAPVRPQTGTLTVCTHDENGNVLITLDDILPANNISRPVRLVNVGTGAIEWQGFLSCEAYDQDYTDIPQHLQLPLISVLEAMASVEVDQTKLSGLNTVATTIQKLLEIFIEKAGVSYFSQYYIPTVPRGMNIIGKYIDATVLFEQKEYNNENSTTYIISGLSLRDCLERIAVYMGWCVREVSASLYFFAVTENNGYRRYYRVGRVDPSSGAITYQWLADFSTTQVVTREASELAWVGVDHRRTVQQGAKSVEVVAKLEKYELNISIPDCPVGSLVESYYELKRTYGEIVDRWLYLLANTNTNAYSNMMVAYYSAYGGYHGNTGSLWNYSQYAQSTITALLSHISTGSDSSVVYWLSTAGVTHVTWYAGAFLCKYVWEETGTAASHNTTDALYCAFFPFSIYRSSAVNPEFDPSQIGAIFSIDSIVSFRASNGYIKLIANDDIIHWLPGLNIIRLEHSSNYDKEWSIALELRIGINWWNGSRWQDSQCYFFAPMTKSGFVGNWEESFNIPETDGLLIPITTSLQGVVTLKIWPMISYEKDDTQGHSRGIFEMIFSSLEVGYIPPLDSTLSDRSENHYFRLLGTNFRDEISIGTDLASMLNNQPSPSLIMNSETEAMTELNYGTTQAPVMRRPEVDLLNRLAAYYGAARQRLDLIVKHPTAAPLPLLRLNGISPDSRTYAPLAESRDWQEDTSTLKCFETI